MKIPQLFYRIIYQKQLNFILRTINYSLKSVLPDKIQIPPAGILNIQTDFGNLIFSTNQTSYLTQLLYWKGYKNFEYSSIFEDLVQYLSSFFDIGANIGYYSLLAANANAQIKVHAFEPALGPHFYLKENIRLNNFENNIQVEEIALSNQQGQIDFYEVQNQKYSYLKYNLAGEGNTGTKKTSRNFIKNKVNTITLSAFIKSRDIKNIDLIKIDTEGTEIHILESGKDVIRQFEPIVICETLFDCIEFELEQFFLEMNYHFYNHTSTGLQKVSSIQRKTDNGVRNCFFVPNSKLDLIANFVTNT